RPVALLIALDFPNGLAGLTIQREKDRFCVVVTDYIDSVLMHDRRRGGAPSVACFDCLESSLPNEFSVEVKGKDTDVAEIGIHPLAVGGGRLARKAVLQMARERRDRFVDFAFPDNLAVRSVDCVDHPAVLVARYGALAAEVESLLGFL